MRRVGAAWSLSIVTVVILLLIFMAPLIAETGTVKGLDGSIAVMDHWNIWRDKGLTGLVYAFGDIICHQIESRSLMLNDNQMPICIRDLSILLGFAAGSFVSVFLSDEHFRSRRVTYLSLAFIALGLADWMIHYITGFDLLFTRMTTGLLAGIGFALLLQKFIQKMLDDVSDAIIVD